MRLRTLLNNSNLVVPIMRYYCVGFNWNSKKEKNQLPRFIKEGIWENGYDDKFQNTINNIPVGSRLAAKTTYTRKEAGKTISVLEIHALGTVKDNPKDGHSLQVDWDKDFKDNIILDGRGAYRSTISSVNNEENVKLIFENITPKLQKPIAINQEDKEFNHPINQILFGPPGTGKTYHTVNKAVAIIEEYKVDKILTNYGNRMSLKEHFDELLISDWDNPTGQIAFVTFHQSMSYEDFVEGIKPIPPKTENGQVIYKVEDGIFKKIAKLASQNQSRSITIDDQKLELTEDLFEELYYDFAATLNPADQDISNCELTTTEGYKFGLYKNTAGSITIKAGKQKTKMSASFNELRKVHFEKKIPVYQSYEPKIIDKILENKNYSEREIEQIKRPYVLIIDEINRGNISQIFGELITLIEDDKRKGNHESIELILPYSKERFSVPPNLFIVGTMNTADRSVEALDTALRRRFYFEEIFPKPELLTPQRMLWQFWWDKENYSWDNEEYVKMETPFYKLLGFPEDKNNEKEKGIYWDPMRAEDKPDEKQIELLDDFVQTFNGVNLSLLLTFINRRIEKLLSKDYMIGHAYLINVRSIEDLKIAFFNKIMPLLQEYFYGDYGRIGLVIGTSFLEGIENSSVGFMEVKGYDVGDLNDNRVYKIKKADDFSSDDEFVASIKTIYAVK